MTAAKTVSILDAQPVTGLTVQHLKLEELEAAPWNARKTFDRASLEELVASIEEHGIQIPLTVRKVPDGYYEVVCGHRRLKAAVLAGIRTLPCLVREISDADARELGLVDNLQRVDVPALEEADAYNELKARLATAAAIAARVGKSVSYVSQRLQLVSLAELARKALAERLITVDHAMLLAKLGAEEQLVNLKWCLSPGAGIKEKPEDVLAGRIKDRDDKRFSGYYEAQSVLDLKHHIEEHVGRQLSSAPWALEDADLVAAAGACSSCPSNTKANDSLFGDMNIDAATCENGRCFDGKRETFVRIRLEVAGERSDDDPSKLPIRLSWKSTTVKPRASKREMFDADGFNRLQTFKYGQWLDAKPKSCEFLRTGVTVDWDEPRWGDRKKARKPGEIITVCIAERCKVHKKGYDQPARKANGQGHDPKAEEQKREQKKQAAIAESKIRMMAATKAIEQVSAMPAEALRALLLGHCFPYDKRPLEALMPGLVKFVKEAKLESAEFARAVAILSISGDLQANEYEEPKQGRSEFLASLKRLGYDGSSAWLEAKASAKKAAAPGHSGASSSSESSPAPKKPAAKKPTLSSAAKKRIADAQRKRWAKAKVAKKKGGR